MPIFKYRAYSATGDLAEGEIDARSVEDAEDALFKRGLTPFETREARAGGGLNANLAFGRSRIGAAQLASFTREFATLEQADIPLDHSLRILSAQSSNPALRELALEILAKIVDGSSLSDAMAKRPDVFGQDYINVVREGETVGRVGAALTDLADMQERNLELRSRIQSALIYPAMLITLAMISTGVVLGTLVPNIAPIFADNGRSLPSGLQFIIDAEAHGVEILAAIGAIAAGVFMFFRMAKTRPALRAAIDRTYLRIPIIGPTLAQYATARFSRTLGSMLKAGVPLLQALESARAAVTNMHLNNQLADVIEAVRGGAHLSDALTKVEPLPAVAPQMIGIGEETGQLDEMLLRVATMFERQTQRYIERAMSMLTPALTITIAAVVGGLIMTVMDAVLGINELAK
ncbi:MAG: type II secretion system F family protein [Methylocystis sp.]|nr:type II secretion system F family protein [Methylocystis sp.]